MIEVLSNFCNCVERASIDEAYLDLTEEAKKLLTSQTSGSLTADQLSNTFVEGFGDDVEEDMDRAQLNGEIFVDLCALVTRSSYDRITYFPL